MNFEQNAWKGKKTQKAECMKTSTIVLYNWKWGGEWRKGCVQAAELEPDEGESRMAWHRTKDLNRILYYQQISCLHKILPLLYPLPHALGSLTPTAVACEKYQQRSENKILMHHRVHKRNYVVLWSTQRLSTFMSTQRISRHVDITFNISTKEQWKIKCQ